MPALFTRIWIGPSASNSCNAAAVASPSVTSNVTARAEQGNVYLIELAYCGLVGMRNLPDEQAHAFLYAEAPRILFPFARRVVADASRDLGYQPLMLDPIDFNGLYFQRLQQQAEAQGAQGEAPAADA